MWTTEQTQKILLTLVAVSEIYNRHLSESAIEIYLSVLRKYPFEEVKRAFETHIRESSFFPKPGDIIACIEGELRYRADKAWVEVKDALESVGTWNSIKFRDPVINAIIQDLGGWIKLGKLTEQELGFLGNEFKKIYNFYLKSRKVPQVNYLPGLIETLNNSKGIKGNFYLVEYGSPLPEHIKIDFIQKKKELTCLKNLLPEKTELE